MCVANEGPTPSYPGQSQQEIIPVRHKTRHKGMGSLFGTIFTSATILKWRVNWLAATEKESCKFFSIGNMHGLDDLNGPYFLSR